MPRVLLVLACLLGLVLEANAETRLRSDLRVDAEIITLGDIFEDAGEAADVRVANAPPAGERLAINAARFAQFARRHGITWRRGVRAKWVWVTRASPVVPKEEIVMQIELALLDQGVANPLQIVLRETRQQLHVAMDAEPTVVVERLDYDPQRRTFGAVLLAPADSPTPVRRRVSGRVHSVVELPVLRNPVGVGEIIKEADVRITRMRANHLDADMISDAAGLIGLLPKRPIRPGRSVRASYVQEPVIVTKGDVVTMILRTDYMLLTMAGRARQNGSLGATIDVLNPKSKRVVQGIVESPSRVRIVATSQLIIAAE